MEAGQTDLEPASAAVVFGAALDSARGYVGWLVDAGVQRGLIGPREPARIWSRHVLNCAVLGDLVPEGAVVVDVGSGAGLPGIPLALARPDCVVTLVEPLERRATFLREVVADLGIGNVRVIRGRADEVVGQCGNADVVTSRAVAPLAKLAAWSVPLSRAGGLIAALKGSTAADEVARDRAQAARNGLVNLAVRTVGVGVVDPPTVVIVGTVSPPPARRRRSL